MKNLLTIFLFTLVSNATFAQNANSPITLVIHGGAGQLTCDDGTSLDFETGTLWIHPVSASSMTFQATFPFNTTFEAEATLTGGSHSAMAGVGRWSYDDEDIGFRINLIGVFTAQVLP